MNRLILLYVLLITSCDLRTNFRAADTLDEGSDLPPAQLEEMRYCTPDTNTHSPITPYTATAIAPSLPCATDNPCLVAGIDHTTGTCTLKIVDQQGEVHCDDHNPCTVNDVCYDEYCLGEAVGGCDLDDTYSY